MNMGINQLAFGFRHFCLFCGSCFDRAIIFLCQRRKGLVDAWPWGMGSLCTYCGYVGTCNIHELQDVEGR